MFFKRREDEFGNPLASANSNMTSGKKKDEKKKKGGGFLGFGGKNKDHEEAEREQARNDAKQKLKEQLAGEIGPEILSYYLSL